MICVQCNKNLDKLNFYILKTGTINSICKECCCKNSKEYLRNQEYRDYLQLKRHYYREAKQNVKKTLLLRDLVIAFNKRDIDRLKYLIKKAIDLVKNREEV